MQQDIKIKLSTFKFQITQYYRHLFLSLSIRWIDSLKQRSLQKISYLINWGNSFNVTKVSDVGDRLNNQINKAKLD